MVKVLGLCGAGGTGKTTFAKHLVNAINNDDTGMTAQYCPSVTREFYALKGISDEKEFNTEKTLKERFEFQCELYEFYTNDIVKKRTNATADVLVFDRMPVDHKAYTIYTVTDTFFNLPDLENQIDIGVKDSNRLFDYGIFKGYPQPFSQTIDPDPFRYAPPRKNYIISGLMLQIFQKTHFRNSVDIIPPVTNEDFYKTFSNVVFGRGSSIRIKD